ncbi:MAG: phosphoenolpyruvate--protein phosphotransferase [Spirochaetales bacterium]
MKELVGIPASPGIAIGPVFTYSDGTDYVPRYRIEEYSVNAELERFHDAIKRAREEIESLQEHLQRQEDDSHTRFLDSHRLMLSDPEFTNSIEENVRSQQYNVEWILYHETMVVADKLAGLADDYLRERSVDIHDVGRRVLSHLLYRRRLSLSDLNDEVVLVCQDLLPSDAVSMNKRKVRGIAMNAGGKTSHTAIIARAFEIPAVLGVREVLEQSREAAQMIVDGTRGRVILDPDESTLNRYRSEQSDYRAREVRLMRMNELPAETKDGKLIHLKANIELPEEVEAIFAHGADGIGLFRSEFLFLNAPSPSRHKLPDEESQFKAYRHVIEAMQGKPVTIRTLDVGGDKIVPEFEQNHEKNPLLGWRAIRYCLSKPDLFRTQLRAMLRASVYGNLRIMFPMISGIEELNRAFDMLDEVSQELREAGEAFAESIPVGIMIEIPSAALTSDILARRADFFSVGTNDLIQYTLAVDRGNERVSYLYEPFHPGLLRLLNMVVENAHRAGIPVGMCGEMAGDPVATMLLVGLGFDELSMSAAGIPEVKEIIRSLQISEAEELLGTVMDMRSYEDIDGLVRSVMKERFDVRVYN